MLDVNNAALIIVDVQGKLAQLMHDREALFVNLVRMAKGAKVLDVPIIWNEQNPLGLGETIPELKAVLQDQQPLVKNTFSCYGNPEFQDCLDELERNQLLLVGIEAHVCVYQTALELLEQGYEVHLVADAVSSRTRENRDLAIERLRDAGVEITSTEMCLFELLRVAEGAQFKEILKLVK